MLKFGRNGELYCNTFKSTCKQARNMISDGCYGNMSGTWTFVNNATFVDNPHGYKCFRSFKIPYGSQIEQQLPNMIAGHKYYLSCRYSSNDNFERKIQISGSSGIYLDFASSGAAPSLSNWELMSIIFTSKYSGEAKITYKGSYENSTEYVSRFIMIDLTDTFGAGNEPNSYWCDRNIREQEVIINYGCVSNNMNNSGIGNTYFTSECSAGTFNYLSLDSRWEPREYMYMLTGDTTKLEGYVNSKANFNLSNTKKYYAYVDYHKPFGENAFNQSIEFYFPVAEPALGRQSIVDNKAFNGGGGMWEWKRASAFNNRTSFTNGTYPLRVDFNNENYNHVLRLTAINLIDASSIVNIYNQINNCSISINDINKSWCDRWIDGRSSPIIHINDHQNKKIKLSKCGDIVCNDIIIQPERTSVKLDYSTGTIYCSKLIKEKNY